MIEKDSENLLPKRKKLDTPQAFASAITELPTATIELDIPKVGKKPTKEQMDNLKKAGEAMAVHEDKMILETLHTPHLTMGSPAEDFTGIRKATPEGLEEIDQKLRNNEFVMLAGTNPYHDDTPPFEDQEKEEKEESDRLRGIEQESVSYVEQEEDEE